MSIQARVLQPPMLKYGPGSKQANIVSFSQACDDDVRMLMPLTLDTARRGVEYVSRTCTRRSLTILMTNCYRIDKKFWKPATIERWIVVIYERQQRFGNQIVGDMIAGLVSAARDCGEYNPYSAIRRWSEGHFIRHDCQGPGAHCSVGERAGPHLSGEFLCGLLVLEA